MNQTSDPLPDDTSPLNQIPQSTISAAAADQDWQSAQERILLYLRAMNIPAQKCLELALEALRRAGSEDFRTPGGHPASSAMRALRELTSEHATLFGTRPEQKPGENLTLSSATGSMPPLLRKSMVPEEIDRRPWLSFFARCVKKDELSSPLFATSRLLYLILLLALLVMVLLDTGG